MTRRQIRRREDRRRRGAIFIVAIGVMLILGSLTLVFCMNMRAEAMSAANRVGYLQADAIEQGVEQWMLNLCESYPGDGLLITQYPANAVPVGDGYYWILTPSQEGDDYYAFGITDECGKININKASEASLELLPGMSDETEACGSIINWRSSATATPNADGDTAEYYEELNPPYEPKNAPFESVEELLLVSQITPDLLWGMDIDHNGVVTDDERAIANESNGLGLNSSMLGMQTPTLSMGGTEDSERGFYNDVTVYSIDPSSLASDLITPRMTASTSNLSTLLQNYAGVSASQAQTIASAAGGTTGGGAGAGGRGGGAAGGAAGTTTTTTTNLYTIYTAMTTAGLAPEQFALIEDYLNPTASTTGGGGGGGGGGSSTTTTTTTGLVNANTAPAEVLACLPLPGGTSLSLADAQNIVDTRQGTIVTNGTPADMDCTWVFGTLTDLTTAQLSALAPLITGRSFQYSADIVAVSGNGRGFKRVRIVVDARTIPAQIVYRKDLTDLGWPLDPQILVDLQNGDGIDINGPNNPDEGIMSF
jgi:DNA uptake protein ComE-like DNA-binding protein